MQHASSAYFDQLVSALNPHLSLTRIETELGTIHHMSAPPSSLSPPLSLSLSLSLSPSVVLSSRVKKYSFRFLMYTYIYEISVENIYK